MQATRGNSVGVVPTGHGRGPGIPAFMSTASTLDGDDGQSSALGGTEKAQSIHRQAIVVIAHLVRNSAVASIIAAGLIYIITLGNIFSGSSPAQQSIVSFTVACMGWTTLAIGIGDLSIVGAGFLHVNFLVGPRKHRSWQHCIIVLLRRTLHLLVLAIAACISVTYAVATSSERVRKWKVYFYVTVVISHLYRTRVLNEAQRIYETETVEGASRGIQVHRSSWTRMLKKNMSMIVVVYPAILYVQGSTHLDLQSPIALVAFAAVSLAIKLLTQELMIHDAMGRRKLQVNRMYAMLAIPTILFDTQVRILLLRSTQMAGTVSSLRGLSSNNLRALASVVLGVIEVVIRVGRTWWMHACIRRQWTRRITKASQSTPGGTRPVLKDTRNSSVSKAPEMIESVVVIAHLEFQQWVKRRLALYAAEAQAARLCLFLSTELTPFDPVWRLCRTGHARRVHRHRLLSVNLSLLSQPHKIHAHAS